MQEQEPEIARQGNYNSIDLIKFICSLLVVAIHIEPIGYEYGVAIRNLLNFFIKDYFARIAVPFFFVSSGYFLYRKYFHGNYTSESSKLEMVKEYVLKILKLYIIWTVIYFPLSFIGFFADERGMIHATAVYIRNVIFVGGYQQLWYLNATIFAVILVTFLLTKKVSIKKIITVAFILYVIGLFAQSWFGFIRPIQKAFPTLWGILKLIQKIMVTTRNGLFEGFLFIGIGILFALNKIKISKKTSLYGFIISMFGLLVEACTLKYYNIARVCSMYLFLVPAVIFMFSWVSQIRLQDSPKYKVLRELSILIFYSHNWIKFIVLLVAYCLNSQLVYTSLFYVCVVVVTILTSLLIMKLSKRNGFRWLRKIY